ncbi:DMT family transporter [Kitasatospora sp. NPDC001540]|uniref:DMT family transporter n=1 Tax=Kitasatospora sp. NPDC001540 TaxID=3364014 RepID=UPI00367EF9A3
METVPRPQVDDVERAATSRATPGSFRLAATYLFVCLIWGTTWYGMKLSVESIPPITAAGLRFCIAFPFLAVAVLVSRGASFRFPTGKKWLLPFVSLVYIAIPYSLINYGEQHVSSGFASLLFASVTVFLLVFSRIISRITVSGRQWAGVVAGLVCLVVLILHTNGDLSAENLLAPAAVLAAAVLHAMTYATLARHAGEIDVLTVEVLPIGCGGVSLLLLGILSEHPDFGAITGASWAGVLYLGIVASVVGFAAYFYLLKYVNAVTLSFVFVFFPVIAVLVSSVVEHSAFDLLALLLAAGMLGSFALTKKRAADAAGKGN